MGKRISLNENELYILQILFRNLLTDGGDYVNSGVVGKYYVKTLAKKLGVEIEEAKP